MNEDEINCELFLEILYKFNDLLTYFRSILQVVALRESKKKEKEMNVSHCSMTKLAVRIPLGILQ